MYSLLIVDDEKIIRNGIRDLVPWERCSIGQIHTAENARQALEILAREQIDILLTDINMPETTGVEMIRQIRPGDRPLKTVVLTGFSDFEIARQCCRMQVDDFLLKPISEEDLLSAISTQIRSLDEHYAQEHERKIQRRARELKDSVSLERALNQLVHGSSTAAEAEATLRSFGYEATTPCQYVLVIPYLEVGPDWQTANQPQIFAIKNVLLELIDSQNLGISFIDTDWRLGLILFADSSDYNPLTILETIAQTLINEVNVQPKLIPGPVVANMTALPESYAAAEQALESITNGESPVLASPEHKSRTFQLRFGELRHFFSEEVQDEQDLNTGMLRLETLLEDFQLTLPVLRGCCFELMSYAYYTHVETHHRAIDNRLSLIMHSLQNSEKAIVLQLTREFLLRLLPHDADESNETVQTAKRYIHEHLADELTVSLLAEQLFVNANYFSRLFKKTVGTGCNEYIIRKRMEQAEALLQTTSLPTGNIAEQVGYRDKNYFSLAFKKITGLSPTAYREAKK